MQVIDTVAAWRKALDAERARDRVVGLVPTMGALHGGHASLIARSATDCDLVAVTVFVNPLQFGAGEDLAAYPRTLDADLALAAEHGAALVFAPSVEEMYPRPIATTVSVAGIASRWEGATRPGHFDGVATVVTKLLAQAGACRAYFGEKDYQQLCVIRRLVADLDLPVAVVGCPTVREADGLALSSRNAYLTPDERSLAPALHQALLAGAAALAAGGSPDRCRQAMAAVLTGVEPLELVYAEPVDPDTLEPLAAALLPGASARLLIAARLGRTRLIDNLGVTRACAAG
jgi:pantoate--beta-alanine ligase